MTRWKTCFQLHFFPFPKCSCHEGRGAQTHRCSRMSSHRPWHRPRSPGTSRSAPQAPGKSQGVSLLRLKAGRGGGAGKAISEPILHLTHSPNTPSRPGPLTVGTRFPCLLLPKPKRVPWPPSAQPRPGRLGQSGAQTLSPLCSLPHRPSARLASEGVQGLPPAPGSTLGAEGPLSRCVLLRLAQVRCPRL